jgi:hypothetical protein
LEEEEEEKESPRMAMAMLGMEPPELLFEKKPIPTTQIRKGTRNLLAVQSSLAEE